MTMAPSALREPFGRLPDGREVERVTLRDGAGFEICVITYGAAVQSLFAPDRQGRYGDVVLGHDDLAAYVADRRYFGATVGRYANRIAGGSFPLDGRRYAVPANDGPNALHGGIEGFDRKCWSIETLEQGPRPSVTLSYLSLDGEEGYPGMLAVRVTYSIPSANTLAITFEAESDQATIVNLTHHGFFNLAGVEQSGDILDHRLTIEADSYLPVDATAIPLGAPQVVAGTPFDFRAPRSIGERIRAGHEQIRRGRGYDHNFCLRGGRTTVPRPAARIEDPASGRVMALLTDQPGLQFYSGNFLDATALGKYGHLYRQSDAFCLEPQTWPDAPNRPDYPSARLEPGQTYRHRSIYQFSVA